MSMPSRQTLRAELALLIAASLWGTMYPFSEWLIDRQGVGPFMMLACKFSLASVVLIPFMIWRERSLKRRGLREAAHRNPKLFMIRVAGNGLVVTAAFAFMAKGFETTTATNAAIITATNIVFIPIIAPFMGRPRPPKIVYLAVSMAMLGIALITDLRDLEIPGIGDMLILVCALMFAIHVVWITIATPDHDVFQFNAAVIIFAALCYIPLAWLEGSTVPTALEHWGAIFWLAIPGGALTGYLMFWAQRHITESHAAVIFSIEPVDGSALGILYLKEPVSSFLFIGGGLVLAGMLIARPVASREDAPGLPGAAEPIH